MKGGEWVPSLFFLALSFFICQQSFVIGVGSIGQPGPGLLSLGAGLAMGGLTLCILIQSFFSKAKQQEVVKPSVALKSGKLVTVCISLFVYMIAVNHLGFVLSTFLFVVFLLRLVESKKWWRILLEATLITIGNYILFVVWLGMNLPVGLFSR
jgi:putative tricarboxylic transport membrane protein